MGAKVVFENSGPTHLVLHTLRAFYELRCVNKQEWVLWWVMVPSNSRRLKSLLGQGYHLNQPHPEQNRSDYLYDRLAEGISSSRRKFSLR
jgi:hypothetical protein